MPDKEKKGKLTVVFSSKNNVTPLSEFTNVLSNVQTAILTIGDYIEGKAPRISGDFPKSVRETCELQVTDVHKGSICIDLRTSQPEQQRLGETIGEKSVELLESITEEIDSPNYRDKIPKLIPDLASRKRILQVVQRVIPETEDFKLEIGGTKKTHTLNVVHIKRIDELIPRIELSDSKKVTGRLIKLRVDSKNDFMIDTQDGSFSGKYSATVTDFFKKNIGEIVRLEAKIDPKHPAILLIDETSNVKVLNKYPISNFVVGKKSYAIKKSIEFDVKYIEEEKQYIFNETKFNLFSYGKTFKECSDDLQKQLATLWKAYVDAPSELLTLDALELKKKLIEMTE